LETAKSKSLTTRLVVGFSLGGVFLLTLIHPLFFVLLVATAAAAGTRELATAMRSAGWHVPRIPATIAGFVMPFMTYFFGPDGQWLTLWLAIGLMVAWRLLFLALTKSYQSLKLTLRDFGASAFTMIYVPLLLSFAVLINQLEKGTGWIFGTVLTVVAIDSFGFLIGRIWGRTKLSPEISPKKSWEGLLASAGGAVFGGLITALLVGASLWFGLIFGLALLASSVMGDLSESLIKRDLQVKDMSDVLPGHGGVMDRIDSLLPSLFVAYLLSHVMF
jgi:phosphatidate cytidylyltransferase